MQPSDKRMMENISEYTSCDYNISILPLPPEFFQLADPYPTVAGALIFAILLPFVLLEYRTFPISTLLATLLGALLMVVFQVLTEEDVYRIIGSQTSLRSVFVVVGMLVIVYFFHREEVILKILRNLLQPHLRFENYMLRVCVLSFMLSVFFTSDVCCVLLTPVLLKFWESQERPKVEVETIQLAIATSANIGAMVLVISSLPMVLITAKLSDWRYVHSRLDMRACVMYLLPIGGILFLFNTGLLVLHYRLRYRKTDKAKLISETSQSEQEMAGLTIRNSNGQTIANSSYNGYIHNKVYDGVYFGPENTHRSDDRISVPCQLETIMEDEILELSSCQSTSVHDGMNSDSPPSSRQLDYGYHSEAATRDSDSSSTDSDEEQNRMCNTDNLHQLNVNYRPGALQSQNLTTIGGSSTSLTQSLDQQGLQLSQHWGIYRSLGAFSAHTFLPSHRDMMEGPGGVSPTDSVGFLVTLCLLMAAVIGLLLASCFTIKLDFGLVPLAAGVFAVLADVVISRRVAAQLVRQVDWSVIFLLFALFVWVAGFNKTHLLRVAWDKLGLRGGSYDTADPITVTALGIFAVVGTNVIGGVPVVLLVLDVLEPCAQQQKLVLYLVLFCTVASNLTMFGSVSNLIVVQKGQQVLKHRLTFLSYLKFGFPSTVVCMTVGVALMYGLSLIGMK